MRIPTSDLFISDKRDVAAAAWEAFCEEADVDDPYDHQEEILEGLLTCLRHFADDEAADFDAAVAASSLQYDDDIAEEE
jgi:hypothetical protein